jgi:hypothetical protein
MKLSFLQVAIAMVLPSIIFGVSEVISDYIVCVITYRAMLVNYNPPHINH